MDGKIRIENLTKKFNDVTVLEDISLTIRRGEITVFVGPSGCGKTTLMRCIVGFESPEDGRILIDGEDVEGILPKDRDIAMVFQYYSLYPNMSVRKNLSVALELTKKYSKQEIEEQILDMARILNLSHLLDRKPSQLSGGEAQRVSIGRALIRNTSMIFLDEPLSAVDAKLRRELRSEIRKILKKFNVTAIYVTHDQEEAMAIADQMVLLCGGHVLGVGTPEQMYKQPRNISAAKLLGRPPINLFRMNIEKNSEGYFLSKEGMRIPVSDVFYQENIRNNEIGDLIVGVRPNDFIIAEPETMGICEAKVVSVENLGDEVNLFVSNQGQEFAVHVSPEQIRKRNEMVRLNVLQENLQIFESDSEKSILWE